MFSQLPNSRGERRINGPLSARMMAYLLIGWLIDSSTVRSQFDFVLNVPPDPNIADVESITSDTQLNLFEDGAIGDRFRAGDAGGTSDNTEVNILGGLVGNYFDANSGSTVNISGGEVGAFFDAFDGSKVNVSSGNIGRGF